LEPVFDTILFMDDLIKKIAIKEFGTEPTDFTPVLDKGVRNKVFKVIINNTDYIFRLNKEKNASKMYRKEKWCIDKAQSVNIKTSECYAVGDLGEYSYMILNYIEGVNGDESDLDKKTIFRKLGECAKSFNPIEAGGFGRDEFVKDVGFDKNWKEFLDYQFIKLISDNLFCEKDKSFFISSFFTSAMVSCNFLAFFSTLSPL